MRRARLVPFFVVLSLTLVWLRTRPNCASSFAGTAANSLSADGLTLLDPAKLNASNLNHGRGIRYTLPHVLRAGHPAVALDSLLLDGARRRALTWTVDGEPAANGRLLLTCEPPANRVAVRRIVVADGEGSRDEFVLVVIPTTTAVSFQEWLRVQREDVDWIRTLPPVYSSLGPGGSNPEPDHCHPKLWPVLRKVNGHYHPGAAYEMRSAIRQDGSGHQATYDAGGRLLRQAPGAGTADRASPRPYSIFRLIAHRDRDVLPFIWAAQLDGNPVNPQPLYSDFDAPLVREGDHLRAYMSVRPAFNPARQEVPPGVCVDGRAP